VVGKKHPTEAAESLASEEESDTKESSSENDDEEPSVATRDKTE
jgi:hypothetical protein